MDANRDTKIINQCNENQVLEKNGKHTEDGQNKKRNIQSKPINPINLSNLSTTRSKKWFVKCQAIDMQKECSKHEYERKIRDESQAKQLNGNKDEGKHEIQKSGNKKAALNSDNSNSLSVENTYD